MIQNRGYHRKAFRASNLFAFVYTFSNASFHNNIHRGLDNGQTQAGQRWDPFRPNTGTDKLPASPKSVRELCDSRSYTPQ